MTVDTATDPKCSMGVKLKDKIAASKKKLFSYIADNLEKLTLNRKECINHCFLLFLANNSNFKYDMIYDKIFSMAFKSGHFTVITFKNKKVFCLKHKNM